MSMSSQNEQDALESYLGTFVAPSACMNDCIVPLAEMPKSCREEIDRGISTGWECLDKYLQGIRKGEMTVITADTGCGKTTFTIQLALNCAMQGVPIWLNSWEMKPSSIVRKLASLILRQPMKFRPFTALESSKFDEQISRYKIYLNPSTIGLDINALAKQLVMAKHIGVKVVMLDHLDYLVQARHEKMHEAIEETVRRLHELALALDMHLLLICHPRQTSTGIEEVGIHSLKGSSSIKQYADNVIILHRCSRTDPSAHPSKVKVRVGKNRMFGVEGATYLFYQPEWDGYQQLEEIRGAL